MLIGIKHLTEYTFSEDVFFEPHYFRFRPKDTAHAVVKEFKLEIEPEPSGLSEQFDIENNHNQFCWFEDSHRRMKIVVESVVQVTEFNPFNFFIHPSEYLSIPFDYDKRTKPLLIPSLEADITSESIKDFALEILRNSNNQSISFLAQLTKEIHKAFSLKTRESGNPHLPGFTFKQKQGSCRDLAWMQIHMLRQLGIASRFVSGYYYIDSNQPEYELHAWVEAYLPGSGWIGLDPSHGMLTDCYHIPVASSAYHENTMPVIGTVRGSAKSTLKNELEISIL